MRSVPMALSAGVSYVDLSFRGTPRIVAAAVLQGAGGAALIDPGPSSTLPALRAALAAAGLSMRDVTALCSRTSTWITPARPARSCARIPALRVLRARARRAAHGRIPAKLLASATRLYGDEMDRLWGEVARCRPRALIVLAGRRADRGGGRQLDVAYTPGHASHHVSYFSAETGIAFVGDTAGIKRRPDGYVLPPTPPPDIDLEAWRESLRAHRAVAARTRCS